MTPSELYRALHAHIQGLELTLLDDGGCRVKLYDETIVDADADGTVTVWYGDSTARQLARYADNLDEADLATVVERIREIQDRHARRGAGLQRLHDTIVKTLLR